MILLAMSCYQRAQFAYYRGVFRMEAKMAITDIGPRPQSFDIEHATKENTYYRSVAWSGRYLQVTLMSIPVGEDIGLEAHPETDQFLRLDAGRGRVQMGPSKDRLTFDKEVSDGWCVLVPAGTWHNVVNVGKEPMQVYAIYAPAHHKPGKIHKSFEEGEADQDDQPAEWSVPPPVSLTDKHGWAFAPLSQRASNCQRREHHQEECIHCAGTATGFSAGARA